MQVNARNWIGFHRMIQSTFMGSRLTKPQARAATPLQFRETATIPIESGPGCTRYKEIILLNRYKKENCRNAPYSLQPSILVTNDSQTYLHPNHLYPVDSSPCCLGKELCQGLLGYRKKTINRNNRNMNWRDQGINHARNKTSHWNCWFQNVNLPSWVISILLSMLSWVLLLMLLTTHDHRLTAIVCGCSRCLKINITRIMETQ